MKYEDIGFPIHDSHIHVGQCFDDFYFSPPNLIKSLKELGIMKWAVSSPTTSKSFDIARIELEKLIELEPNKTMPMLWVTKYMLENSNDLSQYFVFPIFGFKIHGYSEIWDCNAKPIKRVFSIAKERNLPVLLHTGYKPGGPESGSYEKLISEFSDVKVILAHGRPENQTLNILKRNPNAYVDTAYISLDGLKDIYDKLGSNQIIFGSDFPLDSHYYPTESLTELYKNNIINYINVFGIESFKQWTTSNFYNVFNL